LLAGHVLRGPQRALAALVIGIFARMGVPLGFGLAIHLNNGPLAQAGLLYYLLAFYPVTLAIDPTLSRIYVANYTDNATGSIQMIPKMGGAVTTIASGLTWASDVATTTTAVYWAADHTVAHTPLSGGSISTDVFYSMYSLSAITTDSPGSVFYTDSGGEVDGIRVGGGGALTAYAGDWWNECPRGIAADGSQTGNIFYTSNDEMIRYVPKVGLPVQKQLVTGLSYGSVDICISGNYLYYSEGGTSPSINKIPIPAVPIPPTPTFTLTAPKSGTFTIGQNVSVQWNAANVGSGSTISLCYDTDATWNSNEKWIEVDKVTAANGSATYAWNTSGLSAGTYYVSGYLWSGGKAYRSHLTTSITVQAVTPTFTLTAPKSGTFAVGQSVSVQWTDANVGTGSKISLCYDTDTTWN